jgi:hypothetical protein
VFRRDMHYAFDTEFFLRLALAGFQPALIDDELSVRFVHSAAKSADPQKFSEEIDMLVDIFRPDLSRSERIRLKASQALLRLGPRTGGLVNRLSGLPARIRGAREATG